MCECFGFVILGNFKKIRGFFSFVPERSIASISKVEEHFYELECMSCSLTSLIEIGTYTSPDLA